MEFASVKGYKIDFANRIMTVNFKFAKAAAQYGTPEYKLMKAVLEEIPDMEVVEMAGRQNKTCHHDKHLTYENMEFYISHQPNADELMAAYWIARTEAIVSKSRYAHVREWFVKQFPNFRKVSVFVEQTTTTTVVELPAKEAA